MTDQIANDMPQSVSSNVQSNVLHLRQKRARSQLSCIPCRNGKLKCNRVREPGCDQCIKRNRETTCVWAPPPTKAKSSQNVKGRIRQLESLVVDLMNHQGGSSGRPSSNENQDEPVHRRDDDDNVDGATKPFGQMRISKNEISYVGETHWRAILHNISSLKRELEDEEEDITLVEDVEPSDTFWRHDPNDAFTTPPPMGLGFMLGSSRNMTRAQLIASVPEKRTVDRLLSLWFNSPDPFKIILHAPTFQEEYRSFWRDPGQTPTMWLGLLYAILSLAASFALRDCSSSSPVGKQILAEVKTYHALAASAAVRGDFTKPKQHTIECLLLYGAGLRSNDAFVNLWLIMGLCVRLALRMGYHRDSSNYAAISAFHGEMRRRVWAIITMLDVIVSFQLGLPSMVKSVIADTQPPRNLLDRDFNTHTESLPPSRGIDELTPSSYTRAKLGLVSIFAEAAEFSHATVPPSYEEVMQLDHRLDEVKEHLPVLLQMPDISELVTDPAEQLMCRFNLDLLHLKTKLLLHRRYMETPLFPRREQEMGLGMSRKIAVDCALHMLHHHSTIYTASQPGGQLESVKWFMTSVSTNDFLLAAMIICLELSQQITTSSTVTTPDGSQCTRRQALMEALERSQQIWEHPGRERQQSSDSPGGDSNIGGNYMFEDTEKAAIAMGVMLRKVKQKFPVQVPPDHHPHEDRDNDTTHHPPPPPPVSTLETATFDGDISTTTHIWWETTSPDETPEFAPISHLQTPDPLLHHSNPTTTTNKPLPTSSPDQLYHLGAMLDTPGTIDWNIFDTEPHFSNSSITHPGTIRGTPAAWLGNEAGLGSTASFPAEWMSFQDVDDGFSELYMET